MAKQKLHQCDLKKEKLTTHSIWSDQHTTSLENLDREKSDEHAGAQVGNDATPTSSETCKKTTQVIVVSDAQHGSMTSPDEQPQVAST
jgi:hypothetical protein